MYAASLCAEVFDEDLHKLPLNTSLFESTTLTTDLSSCRK